MSAFERLLAERQSPAGNRGWIFVPYDQLSDAIGPLAHEDPGRLGIALIENAWQLSVRPYHKQKLAYIIANLRHFALEQAARGVAVRHLIADRPYRDVLPGLVSELGPMRVMEPAERELRVDLQPLIDSGDIEIIRHEGWLTSHDQFLAARKKGPPWRMDTFYRHVRRETGILMTRGKPRGGKFSFDPSNRQPWRGAPKPPTPPTSAPDPIKDEVAALIERDFAHHPGRLDLDSLPASLDDASAFWAWAQRSCLRHFGPYQDAMSTQSTGLFHTRLSPLINLHRLLPSRVVADVARARIPLPSKEGFIRQLLGWREYMRHVHLASDGFRRLPAGDPAIAPVPGDAGYARWAGSPWPAASPAEFLDGGAQPCALGGDTPLPPAYWGSPSGLACLDRVVADVWREGWSHHITRLVILSSIATLLDVSPRELTDWFWVAYVDAYDWVVEPNVLGMGAFAVGDYLSTKPYITGAAYINRMSDYCERCAFHPRRTCPLTDLYWAFLARHRETLGGNPRMQIPLASLRKRPPARRRRDQRVFQRVRDLLASARPIAPDDLPAAARERQ